MDPNACWKRLCDALREGDTEEAANAAEDLAEWIKKGGFLPEALQG